MNIDRSDTLIDHIFRASCDIVVIFAVVFIHFKLA